MKPAGSLRIAALGGSTTYSTGVTNYLHSYPHLLGEYLHQGGFDHVEVINAGVGGYSSYQTLISLQYRVLPLQPDLIILYQGYNDIHTRLVYPFEEYLGDNSGAVAAQISDTVMPAIWEYSTLLRILGIQSGHTVPHTAVDWHRNGPATTNYRNAFLSQWKNGNYPSGGFSQVSAMDMLENNPPVHFERNLKNMIAVAEMHNVAVLLVTFVTSTEFNDPVVASEEYIFALAQHNEVTRRVAASTGAYLLDLKEVFPQDSSLFTDGRHMNRDGNLLRAQLIGDFIVREFLQ